MAGKLDYRWHLRQVMASRGMFATTDLIEPIAAARAGRGEAGVGELRPKRARIVPVEEP